METKDGLLMLIGDLYATNQQLRQIVEEQRAALAELQANKNSEDPDIGFDTDGDGKPGAKRQRAK